MACLPAFFDNTKDAKAIFKDTEIMQTEYSTVMNTYPTIFLSFADAKGDKNNIVMQMKLQLLKEYKKNKQVLEISIYLKNRHMMSFCAVCRIYKTVH